MYSRLDSIFKANLRDTKSADSWLGIRREDMEEDGRKKKNHDDDQEKSTLWDDDKTTVSVVALKSFLKNMIESAKDSAEPPEQTKAPTTKKSDEEKLPPKRDKAINAYQNTAQLTEPEQYDHAAGQKTQAGIDLTADELRTIHTLIQDLETLQKNDIEQLVIHRSDSFLQGMADAARRAKKQI